MQLQPDQARATAARMLAAVIVDGQTSDAALARFPTDPLTADMFYGALRHYYSLAREVNAELTKPLRQKDQDVWCLLVVGAYQLHYSRVPDHAVLHETVAACRALNKPWLARLVNGVLRSLQRRMARETAPTERSFEEDFPDWIVQRVRRDYPASADEILAANLQRAPLTLRINRARTTPEDYGRLLDDANIGHGPAFASEFLVLHRPMPAADLPGYSSGLVAIQDAGAGFAAPLLDVCPGGPGATARVLDACAAPGGKLFHLMELRRDLGVVALEISAPRLARLQAEAGRLGHEPETVLGDATNLDWWDGREFDAVLVDAPCSGSGTLRRHPDIKLLRTAADLADYAELQMRLLTNLWHTLRAGGSLLYCTCSVFREENDAVIEQFVAAAGNAEVVSISLPTGMARELGWQLLPTEPRTDGFYFSLLQKLD